LIRDIDNDIAREDANAFLAMLERMIDEVASSCEHEGLAPSTTTARLATLDRLFRAVPSLDPRSIESWLETRTNPRTGQPLGPHGKNAYVIAAKWYLKRTSLVPDAAVKAAGLHRYRMPPSPGSCIDPETFEAIVQHAPTATHELAFRLIYERGFRPHEVLSIRACDVQDGTPAGTAASFEESPCRAWVNLPAGNPVTPSGRNKTGARTVPVLENARRLLVLRDLTRAVAGHEGRLFPWKHRHLTTTWGRMRARHAAEIAAAIPVTTTLQGGQATSEPGTASVPCVRATSCRLYDCRHSAITALYLAPVPDQVIRKVVGWTPSSRMPDVYVHVTQAHIQQAFDHAALHPHATAATFTPASECPPRGPAARHGTAPTFPGRRPARERC